MSIWSSIPGTFALHYENSVTDPRKAKRLPGVMPGEFGDEIDLAVVVNDVYEDAPNEEGYLPYLRVGVTVNNFTKGDVILNRKQVKKLRNELNRFLKETKKKKETIEELAPGPHGNGYTCKSCGESAITCGMRENGDCCNHCDHS